jgi:hypothetical protein
MLTVHCDKVTIVNNTSQIKYCSSETPNPIILNKFTCDRRERKSKLGLRIAINQKIRFRLITNNNPF